MMEHCELWTFYNPKCVKKKKKVICIWINDYETIFPNFKEKAKNIAVWQPNIVIVISIKRTYSMYCIHINTFLKLLRYHIISLFEIMNAVNCVLESPLHTVKSHRKKGPVNTSHLHGGISGHNIYTNCTNMWRTHMHAYIHTCRWTDKCTFTDNETKAV